MEKWIVKKEEEGKSLQKFLSQKLDSSFSVRKIKELLGGNVCRVNGRVERFGSRKLRKGDQVVFVSSQKMETTSFQRDPERVLYRDDDLFLYNKPEGISTEELEELLHAKAVHRLDRGTTGVMVWALNEETQEKLIWQFRERTVRKVYWAIVVGKLSPQKGVYRNFLGKRGSFQGQSLWGRVPRSKGKEAITNYHCIEAVRGGSLVECLPETGRTHQIRVHMAELGCPILGDGQYGRNVPWPIIAHRPLLHAKSLSFIHPTTKKTIKGIAPLPTDFSQAWEELKTDVTHYEE